MKALQIAASGMAAQQMRVEVISHNLSNMSTTAYNARRAEFADLHYQQVARPGTIAAQDGTMLPTGIQMGMGVRAASVSRMAQQGVLQATGGELDIAIEGSGWLEVTLPAGGQAYTRDGSLKRTGDGLLVTSGGHEVSPGITIPAETRSLSINAAGEVWAYLPDRVAPEQIGQLDLAVFVNEGGLEAMGSNLYLETEASGPPGIGTASEDGFGSIRQGYLEESTVDAIREVTELIKAQRGYEMNAKVVAAADQMLAATTQVR